MLQENFLKRVDREIEKHSNRVDRADINAHNQRVVDYFNTTTSAEIPGSQSSPVSSSSLSSSPINQYRHPMDQHSPIQPSNSSSNPSSPKGSASTMSSGDRNSRIVDFTRRWQRQIELGTPRQIAQKNSAGLTQYNPHGSPTSPNWLHIPSASRRTGKTFRDTDPKYPASCLLPPLDTPDATTTTATNSCYYSPLPSMSPFSPSPCPASVPLQCAAKSVQSSTHDQFPCVYVAIEATAPPSSHINLDSQRK